MGVMSHREVTCLSLALFPILVLPSWVCLWREAAAAERAQSAQPAVCSPAVIIQLNQHLRLSVTVLPADVAGMLMQDWLGMTFLVFAGREFQALFPDVIFSNLLFFFFFQLSSW